MSNIPGDVEETPPAPVPLAPLPPTPVPPGRQNWLMSFGPGGGGGVRDTRGEGG